MNRPTIFFTAVLMLALIFGGGAICAQEKGIKADVTKIELGIHFSALSISEPNFGDTATTPGVGGRITFNLSSAVALEAEGVFFPERNKSGFTAIGGNTSQAHFGVKAGKHFGMFGIFGKARPGLTSFSSALKEIKLTPVGPPEERLFLPDLRFARRTYFSGDVGAVIEFYPSRRVIARFDLGDTIISYGRRPSGAVYFGDQQTPPVLLESPAEVRHNFQFTAGVGFRF